MEKKTHACPHSRNQLCEAFKELGFMAKRSVAFISTRKCVAHNTQHFSVLGMKGILHQLFSWKQELHCQQHCHADMSQSGRRQQYVSESFTSSEAEIFLLNDPYFFCKQLFLFLFPLTCLLCSLLYSSFLSLDLSSAPPHLPSTFPVLPALLRSALSISKDVTSPLIREHLHNKPMVVKPVPQAANDLC